MVSCGFESKIEFEPTTKITLGYTSAGSTVVFLKGPLGTKRFVIRSHINIRIGLNCLFFTSFSKSGFRHCVTFVQIFKNEIRGLDFEFSKFLELRGLGYRVSTLKTAALFYLGFSHTIFFKPAPKVRFLAVGSKGRVLQIFATSLFVLEQTMASLRKLRLPGVYTERGVYAKYEIARLKVGKKKKS